MAAELSSVEQILNAYYVETYCCYIDEACNTECLSARMRVVGGNGIGRSEKRVLVRL